MFVIRPKAIRGTPQRLARDLGCQSRRWPNRQSFTPDYRRDFLMYPVPSGQILNAPPAYAELTAFASRNKHEQRQYLSSFVPVPKSAASHVQAEPLSTGRYVVRPLRHSRGRGYRITDNRLDFVAGQEYISELYPKRREYRIVFVFGQPLVWMRKKPYEGVGQEEPWGHVNSRFQTINDVAACRLSGTDCLARLSGCPVVQVAHIVAADILFAGDTLPDKPYVVSELNFCPALDIDNNRARVAAAIQSRP